MWHNYAVVPYKWLKSDSAASKRSSSIDVKSSSRNGHLKTGNDDRTLNNIVRIYDVSREQQTVKTALEKALIQQRVYGKNLALIIILQPCAIIHARVGFFQDSHYGGCVERGCNRKNEVLCMYCIASVGMQGRSELYCTAVHIIYTQVFEVCYISMVYSVQTTPANVRAIHADLKMHHLKRSTAFVIVICIR